MVQPLLSRSVILAASAAIQFDAAAEEIQVTHAGRTITGNCGDLPSDIRQR